MLTLKKHESSNGRHPDLLSAIRNEMDRAFNRLELGSLPLPMSWSNRDDFLHPQLDFYENDKQVNIEIELPGVEEQDIHLSISNGRLTIKGQKKSEREEKRENYYVSERIFGSFERMLELPETIDENRIQAKFEHGILKIFIPKRPDAVQTEKMIPIQK